MDNALRVLPVGAPPVPACGWPRRTWRWRLERGVLTERYRGDRPVGSGLGLARVDELALRLGGVAQARPAPEGGAAFAILLPAGLPGW